MLSSTTGSTREGKVYCAVVLDFFSRRVVLSRGGEFELGRAEGLLGPILTRVLRKGWRIEMANLKRLIEARP